MQSMTDTNDAPADIPSGDDADYVTIAEAAHAVSIPQSRLQGWVNRGRIQRYRRDVSSRVYVRLSEVRAKVAIKPIADDDD